MKRKRCMGFLKNAESAVNEIAGTLGALDEGQVDGLIKEILKARRIFFIGAGRSGYVLRCIAKRFFHIGFDVHFVGDVNVPPIARRDLLIVGSSSGEKTVVVSIAKLAKEKGARVAYIGCGAKSPARRLADVFVHIPASGKSRQLMADLFEQSLHVFGDVLALMLARIKKVSAKSLDRHHANLE